MAKLLKSTMKCGPGTFYYLFTSYPDYLHITDGNDGWSLAGYTAITVHTAGLFYLQGLRPGRIAIIPVSAPSPFTPSPTSLPIQTPNMTETFAELYAADIPWGNEGFDWSVKKPCDHTWVDAGFRHSKIVCSKCDIEKPKTPEVDEKDPNV